MDKVAAKPIESYKRSRFNFSHIIDQSFRYWSIAPSLILLIFLTLYPLISLILMSFQSNISSEGRILWTFTGLNNLRRFIFEDEVTHQALLNTTYFVFVAVSVEMIVGFFLALLVSMLSHLKGIIRTIMVLPILVPPVAIGNMWRLMFNYDTGIFNQILAAVGLPPQLWLASTKQAMWCVIMVDIWHWVPFVFLIALAGIEALDIEVLEAARVDGANTKQLLTHIVIPLMWPTLQVVLMLRTIFAFKVFDEIWLLTQGGPGLATEVISLDIYKVFFLQDLKGYGSLISVFTITLISIMTYIFIRIRGKNGGNFAGV